MSTRKALQKVQGTFTASVNGVENFVADTVYLNKDDVLIRVVGVDDGSASVLRIIQIDMDPDIQNGTYNFPGGPIRALIAGGQTAPSHYVTMIGQVGIDFDHQNELYNGHFNFDATNIFAPRDKIVVDGVFHIQMKPPTNK
ncbi:hypothetical protein [Pseudomonas kairouanensis]|nr:hypothetical protein [Pseudomonas kairouanensis]